MNFSKNKLYVFLLIACMAGYMWIFYSLTKFQSGINNIEVCLFKHATHVPCPSCGSTRSVMSLINGDFLQALYINPFGIIISIIMLITPLWILFDIVTRKNTLLNYYRKTEDFFKKPGIAIPFVLFVLINWIWNITKEL